MREPRTIDPGTGSGTSVSGTLNGNGIDVTATYDGGSASASATLNFDLRSGDLRTFSLSVFDGSNRLTQNFDFTAGSFGQTFSHDFGGDVSGSVLWEIGQMDTVRGIITFRF